MAKSKRSRKLSPLARRVFELERIYSNPKLDPNLRVQAALEACEIMYEKPNPIATIKETGK